MFELKKTLVQLVFEKAKRELPRGSKTSIAEFLSQHFEDKYGFSKGEKTFSRYFTYLVEKNEDYTIDEITKDQMSSYLQYENYKDFCEKNKNSSQKKLGFIKIGLNNEKESSATISENLSSIIINIIFTLPDFFTKNKNSFGIVGILLITGFIFSRSKYSNLDKNPNTSIEYTNSIKQLDKSLETENKTVPQKIVYIPQEVTYQNPEKIIISERKKECMYWNEDHYEAVFCDKKIQGVNIIALNEDQVQFLRKINRKDTLTIENAKGKVWYDKNNNIVQFFTYHGLNPENGKTLKPVTDYILNKYAGF